MNSRLFGLLGAVTAALMAGCKSDPTGDLSGKPLRFSVAPTPILLNEGASANIAVQLLDQSLSPLKSTIAFSSTAPAVAGVVPASSVLPDPTGTTTFLTVNALTPGPAYIKLSALGLTDSARVSVLPLLFAGALSTKTPAGGAEMTIKSTQFLKFDPATVSVTFGGASGVSAPLNVANAESLVVVTPFSSAAPLSIAGISVTYIPGREVTLNTKDIVTQTGDIYALTDTSYATAPTLTLPTAGNSLSIVSDPGPSNPSQCAEGTPGPCMIYQFTLAAPTTLKFSTDWTPGGSVTPDVDIYTCPAPQPNFATCFEEGGGGATAAKPQTFTFTFPAGTHYFVVEIFDNTTPTQNIITTITHK